MLITDFITWGLSVYGMATIIVHSKILAPFRKWVTFKRYEPDKQIIEKRSPQLLGDLVHCIMCMGFWCGITLHLLGWSLIPSMVMGADLLVSGCLGTAVSWLIYLFIADLMVNK